MHVLYKSEEKCLKYCILNVEIFKVPDHDTIFIIHVFFLITTHKRDTTQESIEYCRCSAKRSYNPYFNLNFRLNANIFISNYYAIAVNMLEAIRAKVNIMLTTIVVHTAIVQIFPSFITA